MRRLRPSPLGSLLGWPTQTAVLLVPWQGFTYHCGHSYSSLSTTCLLTATLSKTAPTSPMWLQS